jgi:hypothetical protein
MDLAAAFSAAVDHHELLHGGRKDLGEMAQMAAVESLVAMIGPLLPSLFRPSSDEVHRAVGRFASGDRFSILAREFFARLTPRSLGYYLSRELSSHVGPDRRFSNDGQRTLFDDALDRHCRDASRIDETFAGGWAPSCSYFLRVFTGRRPAMKLRQSDILSPRLAMCSASLTLKVTRR